MFEDSQFSELKKAFPILSRRIGEKNLVYLDSAATSQKPLSVIQAMQDYYALSNANIHRGIHRLAEEATQDFENSRQKIAQFIKAKNNREIIFTRNTTESINLVSKTWGEQNIGKDDLIVLTEMEHHSNLVPWYMLAEKTKGRIKFIRINSNGELDMDTFSELLNQSPKLVALTHMSNVLGTINPIKQICQMAHESGAIVVVDGAQSAPHFSIDVIDLEVDFFAFSAHKMCGPTGIGVLFGRYDLLKEMPPFLGGGDMIKKVTLDGYSVNELPHKFEAGTPAIAEVIGFGMSVDFLSEIGMEKISKHEKVITKYAYDVIGSIKGVRIIGPPPEKRGGVISFTLEGIHPHDIAQILDSEGIAVRAGHHCAMPLHSVLKIPASTRASFYLYNQLADVDALAAGINKVKHIFQ